MKSHQMNLEGWLSIATDGLAEEGKDRVHREIEAHFKSAVEEGLRDGMAMEESEATALGSLGDPNSAKRRFRRHYLTEKELYLLGMVSPSYRSEEWLKLRGGSEIIWIVGLGTVLLKLGEELSPKWGWNDESVSNAVSYCWGAIGSAIIFLTFLFSKVNIPRRHALIRTFEGMSLCLLCLGISLYSTVRRDSLQLALASSYYGLWMVWIAYRWWRIHTKIGRMDLHHGQ